MTDKAGTPSVGGGGDDAGNIMALLERVAGLMDSVQTTQQRMEERQLELENTVKTIQSDVVKLTSDHAHTSSTVDRLLEKTRKVSRHIKDVRVRVESQNIRVKKVEVTQGDLLAKNKFRVVIYQVRFIGWKFVPVSSTILFLLVLYDLWKWTFNVLIVFYFALIQLPTCRGTTPGDTLTLPGFMFTVKPGGDINCNSQLQHVEKKMFDYQD